MQVNDTPSDIEDQLLVMAAQDGDMYAIDRLVRRWQKRLWHFAVRITDDETGAWDVTQESWLQAIRGLAKLNDPACFRAWIYRIVTNKALDWLKRRPKSPPLHTEPVQPASGESDDDRQVRQIVQRLKNNSRVVINLYYFEELSIGEISDALEIPAGTVKSRLHTARAELKQIWENTES